MKFVELKNSLKKKIDNVYVLFGEDRFLQDKSINLLKQFAVDNFLDMNFSVYNDENLNVQKMLEEAQTLPFMTKYRFILMRDCFTKLNDADKKMLQNYVASPVKTTVFVMCANEKNDLLKKLEAKATSVDCNFLDMATLKNIVPAMCKSKNKQITTIALEKLIEYCTFDLARIENEIEKLSNYCDGDVIRPEDVEENVPKMLDYETYLLSNAICRRDSGTAMKIFQYIMQQKGSAQYVLGALGNFMRRYFYLQATKNDLELCISTFKIGEYPIKKMISESGVLKKSELMNALNMILQADYEIKAGFQTEENALYSVIMHLTTKL